MAAQAEVDQEAAEETGEEDEDEESIEAEDSRVRPLTLGERPAASPNPTFHHPLFLF
jgi:hypothetical protein